MSWDDLARSRDASVRDDSVRDAPVVDPPEVVIVGLHYAPEHSGNAPYTTGLARHLAAAGLGVTAVVGYPHYPQWRVYPGYRHGGPGGASPMPSTKSSVRHASGTSRAKERRLRLNLPQQCQVETTADGLPLRIDGRAVESVRERWLIDEGWWTDAPVRRRYSEVVLDGGRLTVVFEDLRSGGWYRQRD